MDTLTLAQRIEEMRATGVELGELTEFVLGLPEPMRLVLPAVAEAAIGGDGEGELLRLALFLAAKMANEGDLEGLSAVVGGLLAGPIDPDPSGLVNAVEVFKGVARNDRWAPELWMHFSRVLDLALHHSQPAHVALSALHGLALLLPMTAERGFMQRGLVAQLLQRPLDPRLREEREEVAIILDAVSADTFAPSTGAVLHDGWACARGLRRLQGATEKNRGIAAAWTAAQSGRLGHQIYIPVDWSSALGVPLEIFTNLLAAWSRFVEAVTAEMIPQQPSPYLDAAFARGSVVTTLVPRVPSSLPEEAIERIAQELASSDGALTSARIELDRTVRELGPIQLSFVLPSRLDWLRQVTVSPLKELPVESAARGRRVSRVYSADIPQADDVDRVIEVLAWSGRDAAAAAAGMEITTRQVAYYRHAARCLKLLDDAHQLTSLGDRLRRMAPAQQFRVLVCKFEESAVGEAWLSWSDASVLPELRAQSAQAFLDACAVDLSPSTRVRRARTLMAWLEALAPYHYAGGQRDNPSPPRPK